MKHLHLLLPLALLVLPVAAPGGGKLPDLNASPYAICGNADHCPTTGKIRILDAMMIPSRSVNGVRLAGLSGLAWDDDDGVLYAVSDMGALFGLRPVFRKGRLVDVRLTSSANLIDPRTGKPVRYRRSDAEDLDIVNGRNGKRGDAELVVSFEGEPRVARHRPDGGFVADVPLSAPLNDIRSFKYNRMFEAMCIHPREGILVAPEEPLVTDSTVPRIYRTDAKSWRLPPSRGAIVAMECLPDGDVLLMEREFSPLSFRIVVTLKRLKLAKPVPYDRLLDSVELGTLDNHDGIRLDNFEGLARHRGNRFFMISDDNDTILQRTLLVYFELLDD